jgi:tRNA uridine 5-carboxymethylaminomethyl modification enzyme
VILLGEKRVEAGRFGDAPAKRLGERLYASGLSMGRLKTGTPPRLDARTIAWVELAQQAGDLLPTPLSFLTAAVDRSRSPAV